MKKIDVSVSVERDGELRILRKELRAGQRVDARLVIRGRPRRKGPLDLRGLFKGTWRSAEEIGRYLNEERESWVR